MDPVVSIITPAYNAGKYITKTINSVLAQSFEEWELLIIDDYSSDNTAEVVLTLLEKDNRIKYVRMPMNGGPVKARNHGISISIGRFIAFLDSDDSWFPNKLEVQVKFMLEHNIALSYTSYYADNGITRILRKVPQRLSYNQLLKKCHIGCLTAMYDADQIGKPAMPDFPKRHDWAYWLGMLSGGGYAYGILEPLATYTLRQTSLSANKIDLVKHNWRVFKMYEGNGIKAHYKFAIFMFVNVWYTVSEKIGLRLNALFRKSA
ncbi:glycosyl transferase [Chitinophaga parva]|uniref:Glycosyl transferase n=1 Tax=Chitinophaga parva TaxID=2169414 RepID=A0A2T7BKF1_9BACT|nr:glycosyltransferase family 2 protein [Chitinophaga parva]PUZ28120.1 glycosyl transferase [Chitinophaga parva]